MKKTLLILFLAILSAAPAYADRGGGRGGGWGHGGWGWGGAWILPAVIGSAIVYDLTRPQPYYVQPTTVYAPGYAPVMVSPAPQSWYFCAAANAYYPYVTSCPSGWQAVSATPPAAMPSAPYAPPPR